MAITSAERERRKKVDSVLDTVTGISPDYQPVAVDEAADMRIRDLNALEQLVKNTKFSYSSMGKFPAADTTAAVNVAVLFLSNKNVKVDPMDNCVSLGFKMIDGGVDIISSYEPSTLEDFMELPKKVEGDTADTINSILDRCDCDAIYNAYQSEAMSIMQMYSNTAYSMFNGANIYKRQQYDMKVRGDGACTLYVGYDTRMGKFRYAYNPRFILRAALEEFNMNRGRYKSLKDCYCYFLAFVITHEMMHLITNNVTSSGGVSEVDLGSHKIENQIQDSFINCELSVLFSRVDGIYTDNNSLAPMPSMGINSKISVRAEHNVGFRKDIPNSRVLAERIAKILTGTLKIDNPAISTGWYFTDKDLSKLAGADVFIQVDVNSRAKAVRKNSIIYQKFVNDAIRAITDGKIYDRFETLTELEKVSDKNILPNGTLVRIKGSVDICVIVGYDPDTNLYTLNRTDRDIARAQQSDGTYLCAYTYKDSGNQWGTAIRSDFIPFDPDSRENTWVEGASQQEKKTELSSEELEKAAQSPDNIFDDMEHFFGESDTPISLLGDVLKASDSSLSDDDAFDKAEKLIEDCKGKDNAEVANIIGKDIFDKVCQEYKKIKKSMAKPEAPDGRQVPGGQQQEGPKVFNIGDIVYIRTKNTFGRIVSISSNGQFELEEMKEEQARVLDDSKFH